MWINFHCEKESMGAYLENESGDLKGKLEAFPKPCLEEREGDPDRLRGLSFRLLVFFFLS